MLLTYFTRLNRSTLFTHLDDRDMPSATAMLSSHIGQMGSAAVGNFFLSAVIVFVYFDRLPESSLYIFGAFVYVINFIRLAFCLIYKLYSAFDIPYDTWHFTALSISFINGLAWGFGTVFISMQVTPSQTLVIYIILAGITAGALATSSSSRQAFLFFSVPALIPLTISEAMQFTKESLSLAVILFMYLMLMIMSSRRIYRTILGNIRSVLEKEEVVKELERANMRGQQLTHELLKKSTTDGLTGISNRRFFNESIEHHWNLSVRNQLPISLIIFDIDWFKPYNDSIGHIAGDKCLTKISQLLSIFFKRDVDVVSRFGGEEFAVLLPGLTRKQSFHIAQKFCDFLYEKKINHPKSKFKRVTISGGVSSLVPIAKSSYAVLIEQADKALYSAKRDGRNRVKVFSHSADGK